MTMKMKKRPMKKTLIALGATLWLTGMAKASEVENFFASMNSFQGDFLQTVYQNGQLTQTSFGEVFMKKPLKFRWNYDAPEPMQLVSDGKRFYHYDVLLAQVTSKPVSDVAGSTLSTLLNGQRNIDKTFTVKKLDSTAVTANFSQFADDWVIKATQFYQLTPKKGQSGDAQVKTAVIGFNDSQMLTVFFVEDDFGKNSFLFDNVQQNHIVMDDLFNFVPPAGVDVLE